MALEEEDLAKIKELVEASKLDLSPVLNDLPGMIKRIVGEKLDEKVSKLKPEQPAQPAKPDTETLTLRQQVEQMKLELANQKKAQERNQVLQLVKSELSQAADWADIDDVVQHYIAPTLEETEEGYMCKRAALVNGVHKDTHVTVSDMAKELAEKKPYLVKQKTPKLAGSNARGASATLAHAEMLNFDQLPKTRKEIMADPLVVGELLKTEAGKAHFDSLPEK